jgi:hypothetical protein
MPLAAADLIACGAVPALIASTIRLAMISSLSASLCGSNARAGAGIRGAGYIKPGRYSIVSFDQAGPKKGHE